MAKQNAASTESSQPLTGTTPTVSEPSAAATESINPLTSKVATVAAVAVGVALFEVELIPGMLIGVAAMLAPNLLPRVGNALRPMLKSAIRAGYTVVEKTKETVSEASEQMQDIVAEVRSEQGSASGTQA